MLWLRESQLQLWSSYWLTCSKLFYLNQNLILNQTLYVNLGHKVYSECQFYTNFFFLASENQNKFYFSWGEIYCEIKFWDKISFSEMIALKLPGVCCTTFHRLLVTSLKFLNLLLLRILPIHLPFYRYYLQIIISACNFPQQTVDIILIL